MQRKLLPKAQKYFAQNKKHSVWKKIVSCMGCAVVFVTTYALILPAITMENHLLCGYEEHEHTEECYEKALEMPNIHEHSESCMDEKENIICGYADFVVHTHNEFCYDEKGKLICLLPEIEEHIHQESCYKTVSSSETGTEEHQHTEACYVYEPDVLICTQTEGDGHQHSSSCYKEETKLTCEISEGDGHTHSGDCYREKRNLACTVSESDGHLHGERCFDADGNLVCQKMESAGHAHSDACYEVTYELICQIEESPEHYHDDNCYEHTYLLNCGVKETEAHYHDDNCYSQKKVLTCGYQEESSESSDASFESRKLICTKEEIELHKHSQECFETYEKEDGEKVKVLICEKTEILEVVYDENSLYYVSEQPACGLTEHVHNLECYQNAEKEGSETDLTDERETESETSESESEYAEPETFETESEYAEPESFETESENTEMEPESTETESEDAETESETKSKISETETVARSELQATGTDYRITVLYNKEEAGISEGTELVVAEILPGDARYENYQEQIVNTQLESEETENAEGSNTESLETIIENTDLEAEGLEEYAENAELETETETVEKEAPYIRMFALSLVLDGTEVVPAENVEVQIELNYTTQDSWNLVRFGSDGSMDCPDYTVSSLSEETTCLAFYAEELLDTVLYTSDAEVSGSENDTYSEYSEEDLARVQQVIEMIDALPEIEEIEEQLAEYENIDDMEGYEAYFRMIAQDSLTVYAYYEDLEAELQALVTNADKLMEMSWLWIIAADTLTEVPVYQINSYTQAATILVSGGTVAQVLNTDFRFYAWDVMIVEADANGNLYVEEYVKNNGDIKSSYQASTSNGFVLLLYKTSVDAAAGDSVTVDFDYTSAGAYNAESYGTVSFQAAGVKASKDNSSKLTIVTDAADTRDLIEVNLYDYNNAINDPYNISTNYPGFQQDFGTKTVYSTASSNFGNNITTDLAAGISGLTNKGGTINATSDGSTNINYPISGAIKSELVDGYPALADGTSLKYLFADNSGYAVKKNDLSINGLFRYNSETGAYTYNSRENHAQFNAGSDTFTLYEQIISSNFIMYPFGNFLPFNDIVHTSAQASTIDRDYLMEIANSAQYKYQQGAGSEYSELASAMKAWIAEMDKQYPSGWGAAQAINEYFGSTVKNGVDFSNETELLEKVYSIDFDEATDFFFGMEMKMNFMQPKGGMTGPKGDQEMVFYFTGDDDVWIYIDNVLFLDLSGIHRHVGGEIDFVNGEVRYYSLDTSTGDVSGTPYKTVNFADILGSTDGLNEAGTFKDYSTHTFNFYYMERGAGSGVCRMNFNFPLVEKNSISVTKELTADESMDGLLGDPDFKFQVLKAADEETITEDLFIGAGTVYHIYDGAGNDLGTGITDANGVFTLKAGQTAVFPELAKDAGYYYVRELLDEEITDQYGDIKVNGSSVTRDSYTNVVIGSDTFTGVCSSIKNIADGHTSFTFNNQIIVEKTGSLQITKKLESETESELQFEFSVTIDGEALPGGTSYVVTASDGTMRTEQVKISEGLSLIVLAPGETASIEKILAGSAYTVQETEASQEGYTVQYTGSEGTETDGTKAFGTVGVDTSVEVLVVNAENGVSVDIPGSKTLMNPDGSEHTYTFLLQQVNGKNADGTIDLNALEGGVQQSASVTVSDSETKDFLFTLHYLQPEIETYPAIFYYTMTEQEDAEDATTRYDTVQYLIEVQITQNSGLSAQVTGNWIINEDGTLTEQESGSEFCNILVTSLSVSKQVRGSVSEDEEFEFQITLTDTDELPVTGEFEAQKICSDGSADAETTKLIFDENGTAVVYLRADETIVIGDIPYGTKWTVEEITSGYSVSYQNGSDENWQTGSLASGTAQMGGNEVTFENTTLYVLPETGGGGSFWYTLAGLLFLCSASCLLYRCIERRKEVF